jgi:signal transduction histidine kinase/CheY-like chemotaxis protein/PAS domain-containing protein
MTIGDAPRRSRIDGEVKLVIVDSPDVAAPIVGALEVAEIGAWMWVEAETALYFSPRVLRLLGLDLEPRADLLSRFLRAVHADDRAQVRLMLDREMAAGSYVVRYRFAPPNGPLRWIEDRGRVERGAAGALVRQGGVMRDVTREAGSEQERREADARLEALVNALPVAVWGYSGRTAGELRVSHQNARSIAWRGNLIGRGLHDMPEQLRALWECEIEDVLAGRVVRTRTEHELPGRVLDKTVAPVEVDGVITGVVGVSIDVTEEDRSRRFQSLLNDLTADFASRSSDALDESLRTAMEQLGRFHDAGLAALSEVTDTQQVRLSYSWFDPASDYHIDAEFGGAPFTPLIERLASNSAVIIRSLDDLPPSPGLREWCLERRLQAFVLVPARRLDGVLVVLGIAGHAGRPHNWPDSILGQLRIAGTVLAGVLARVRAETRQRDVERQMQEAQKLESLGVLAGGIAHDFNNLLTAILGNASILRADYGHDEAIAASLEQIEAAAKRAADLTRQMLAYAGRGRFAFRRLDLNALIAESAPMLRAAISPRATLELQLARALPPVQGDHAQLRQLLLNLLLNASESLGDAEGRITIATAAEQLSADALSRAVLQPQGSAGEYVRLSVSDTGAGMPPEVAARIFEPFFTTKFTGRGLGLSAAAGIVRAHRGTLRVDSAPGRGTRLDVLVPVCSDSHTVAQVAAPLEDAWRATGMVLIVDDEARIRELLRSILQRAGLMVVTAEHGRAAVEMFRAHDRAIDAVLVDVTLPGIDGRETLAAIQAIKPSVGAILMSGYGLAEGPVEGAIVLQKPFTTSSLQAAITAALQRAERARRRSAEADQTAVRRSEDDPSGRDGR